MAYPFPLHCHNEGEPVAKYCMTSRSLYRTQDRYPGRVAVPRSCAGPAGSAWVGVLRGRRDSRLWAGRTPVEQHTAVRDEIGAVCKATANRGRNEREAVTARYASLNTSLRALIASLLFFSNCRSSALAFSLLLLPSPP